MTLRKKVQILSALALNSSFFFELKSLCLPVLNCHSCPLAIFACPIGVIGQFSALHLFPFLIVGILLLFGAFLGRFLCGWCCPFGLLQEVLYKIPAPKVHIAPHAEKLKYLVLAVLVIALPFFFGTNTPLFFCKLCPPATLQSALPWAIIRRELPELMPGLLLRATVLLAVVILAAVNLRAFCKMLCPLGALMGIFNKFSLLFIRENDTGCNDCRKCEQQCPMGIAHESHLANGRRSSDCILCAECGHECSASRRLGIGRS